MSQTPFAIVKPRPASTGIYSATTPGIVTLNALTTRTYRRTIIGQAALGCIVYHLPLVCGVCWPFLVTVTSLSGVTGNWERRIRAVCKLHACDIIYNQVQYSGHVLSGVEGSRGE